MGGTTNGQLPEINGQTRRLRFWIIALRYAWICTFVRPRYFARQAVIPFRLGEQPFTLPHPLGPFSPERGVAHLGLYFFKQILIEVPQYEALRRLTASASRACRRLRAVAAFLRQAGPLWGTFDAVLGHTHVDQEQVPGSEDLLDRACAEVLLHGGNLYAVPWNQINSGAPMAAIFRYAASPLSAARSAS